MDGLILLLHVLCSYDEYLFFSLYSYDLNHLSQIYDSYNYLLLSIILMANNVLNHHDQVVILYCVVMMDVIRIIDYRCNNAMLNQVISINMIRINDLSINLIQIT